MAVQILSDEEWMALHEMYWQDERFTLLDCAVMAHCDRHTVRRNFARRGLAVRGRGPRSQEMARLPKWARERIEQLERELADERKMRRADVLA